MVSDSTSSDFGAGDGSLGFGVGRALVLDLSLGTSVLVLGFGASTEVDSCVTFLRLLDMVACGRAWLYLLEKWENLDDRRTQLPPK